MSDIRPEADEPRQQSYVAQVPEIDQGGGTRRKEPVVNHRLQRAMSFARMSFVGKRILETFLFIWRMAIA
jgi:hypothetical protein